MKSMTGYAYHESVSVNGTVSAEIKSYNHRFLDIYIHLPGWLSPLETEIRNYISSRFLRGKIELAIRIKEPDGNLTISVNKNAASLYMKELKDLSKFLGLKEQPGLGMIIGLEGVFETESNRDLEKYRKLIEPVIASAADQLEAERQREGKSTCDDILSHISVIENSVEIVSSHAPLLEAAIKENLRSRFNELLGDRIDENRILAETAVLLIKYSISEELSRLASHLSEFRLEIERNESPGKKLDFLSQEINREINTIGSKTPALEVSRAVVEMKNALENIREQLRNVE